MTTFLQFAALSLGLGGAYALLALGIVVIHRGSGIINLAQGAVAMASTYVYWYLRTHYGVDTALALVVSVLLAALFGIAFHLLVMRTLRDQSTLTRMLATVGILITLTSAATLKFPQGVEAVPNLLPSSSIRLGSVGIPVSGVLIFVLGCVVALALYLLYRFTRFGLASSAITEHRLRAESLGINPDIVASLNWALGSALAAIAGILIAPTSGLSVSAVTLTVIPALAVAVLSGFRSFPIVVLAAFGIGLLQTELQHYASSSSGWVDASPFLILLIHFGVTGRALPGRGELAARLPRVGTGRIRPLVVALALVVGVVLLESLSANWVAGLTTTGITAIIVLSVVVVTGYAGQLSLAQLAIAGLAAWTSSRLVATTGLSFTPALFVGILTGVPIGLLVGLPSLRTRGESLAISTLGLSVAAFALIFTNLSLTGGATGTNVGTPSFLGIDLSTLLSPQRYAVFVLACFAICALIVANIRRSATGRRMLSIRANERAAASVGVNVVATKLYAFVAAAMIASLGGVLLAFQSPTVSFAQFDPLSSINLLSYAIIGGVGYNAFGPVAGSALAGGAIGANILNLFSSSLQSYLTLASGLILIAVLILNPDGVARVTIGQVRWLLGRVGPLPSLPRGLAWLVEGRRVDARSGLETNDATVATARRVTARPLRVRGLSVRFGSVEVLRDVDLEISPGHVVGLIGSNGAGKTTLVDAISGYVRARSGSLVLGDVELGDASALGRARLGIARTFQSLELFDDLTVGENLMVAGDAGPWWTSLRDPFLPARSRYSEGARLAIAQLGLADVLDSEPDQLSYGQRRLVAIARSLAREPSVLMLDEPAAGLSGDERGVLSSLIRELASSRGVGVLVVEHDVELVMDTCDRVVALELGRVIADGTPDEVREHPDVIRSYLGEQPERAVADRAPGEAVQS